MGWHSRLTFEIELTEMIRQYQNHEGYRRPIKAREFRRYDTMQDGRRLAGETPQVIDRLVRGGTGNPVRSKLLRARRPRVKNGSELRPNAIGSPV
jgi:hypothetical protein